MIIIKKEKTIFFFSSLLFIMFLFIFCLLIKELPNFLIVLAKLLNYCTYDFFSFVIINFFFDL